MNKIMIAAVAVMASTSVSFAQGRLGGFSPGQGRMQSVSIPMNVLRSSLPLDKMKLDSLESDAKLFQNAGLPLEALVDLKLTTEQKNTISSLVSEVSEKTREFMRNGDREGAMSVRQQLNQRVTAMLTDDQKKVLEKYPSRMTPGRGQSLGRRGNPPIN